MEENNDFTPQPISGTDVKKLAKIAESYQNLCDDLTIALFELARLSDEKTEVTRIQVLQFIRAKNPRSWLFQWRAAKTEITIPGIDVSRLAEMELIQIDDGDLNQALERHAIIQSDLKRISETSFYYPLSKLWLFSPEVEQEIFELTPEFWQSANDFCTLNTRNERQNQVVPSLREVAAALNKLKPFFNFEKQGVNALFQVINLFDYEDAQIIVSGKKLLSVFRRPGDSDNLVVPNAGNLWK